jgi:hypothetical protein
VDRDTGIVRDDAGSIVELHWAKKNVVDADLVVLSTFAASGALRHLVKLDLERNPRVTDLGVRALACALRDGELPALGKLWLSPTSVTSEGIRNLSERLAQNRRSVKTARPRAQKKKTGKARS